MLADLGVTWLHDRVSADNARLWHFAFALFVAVYIAILFLHVGHGLASVDGHGAIKATTELVQHHRLEVSRPPGHPTTEFYLFGLIAFVLRAFGKAFTPETYLVLQGVAGVAALVVFYELLCRLSSPWKPFFASVSLGLSAQYFANAVDGEEFVWAILFLLLSFRSLLDREGLGPRASQLFISVLCFALATGCRPEVILAAGMFLIYFYLHPQLSWKQAIGTILALGLAILAVWGPVLMVGLQPPWTAGMNLRESIAGGGYRLVFQCFTPPVFVLFCWIFILAIRESQQRTRDAFPENFVFIVSLATPLIFVVALFFHASKPAHAIFVVPFILVLALRHSIALVALGVATIVGCFVSTDIFKDRQLVAPFAAPGSYSQAVRQKPYYRLTYLREILRQADSKKSVIIANAWRWDFEYHLARGALALREDVVTGSMENEVPVFYSRINRDCIILPRDAIAENGLLENWQARGYALKMDGILYRTVFARYDISAPLVDRVQIDNLFFRLFFVREM